MTAAEVLYSGFRCGIVHEAHMPPYASVNPEPGIVRQDGGSVQSFALVTRSSAQKQLPR